MNVRDIMKTEVRSVDMGVTAREAHEIMRDGGFRHLPVTNEGKLTGIVSDGDLRLAMTISHWDKEEAGAEDIPEHITVGDIMTENPAILVPESDVKQSIELMSKHKIGALPVVEKGTLVGIVTQTDLMKLLLELID